MYYSLTRSIVIISSYYSSTYSQFMVDVLLFIVYSRCILKLWSMKNVLMLFNSQLIFLYRYFFLETNEER